jgi:hypothetical protein
VELVTFRISFYSLWSYFIFFNSKLFSRAFECTAEYFIRMFNINIRIFKFTFLICRPTWKNALFHHLHCDGKLCCLLCGYFIGRLYRSTPFKLINSLVFCLRNSWWNERKKMFKRNKKSNLSVYH